MLNTATLPLFLVALFFLQITPGPDMMLVVARGIGQGRKVAILTVAGMLFVAGTVQVGLLVLGLASLMQAYPASLTLLRWAGAGYLLYLGGRLILQSLRGPGLRRAPARPVSGWSAVREGAINNLTNPKSLLFMFAFLPQFVDPATGPVWLQLLLLGAMQKLSGILSLGTVALASGTIGHWLTRWPRALAWQERFTGAVMIGLGLRLLVAGQPPSLAKG